VLKQAAATRVVLRSAGRLPVDHPTATDHALSFWFFFLLSVRPRLVPHDRGSADFALDRIHAPVAYHVLPGAWAESPRGVRVQAQRQCLVGLRLGSSCWMVVPGELAGQGRKER
jgi:hypothetical protein